MASTTTTTVTNDIALATVCAHAIAHFDGHFEEETTDAFITMMEGCVVYKTTRRAWVDCYVEARGCSEKSGQNRWAELCHL